ncbi:MAG: HlyD family efflux transporter periplasmic adaptor subunit [Anaerolineae bacterium]|nr:HlyD family efflux transporter periplasmic adaptor subunit [Anaerolineae bacterium]
MKSRFCWFALIMLGVTMITTGCSSGDDVIGDETARAQDVATSTPVPTAEIAARPTYVVQRGTVEDVFTFTGRWQPRDQMTLSFPVAGTVRQVNVQRGDAVSTGDLLADYDIADLENQLDNALINLETAQGNISTSAEGGIQSVENAEISLANARISLQSTLDNSPWTSVASARLQLDSAEESLRFAERSYYEALSHPEQDSSVADNAYQQLLNAQQQVESAEISYFSAAQNYNNYQYQVEQAENQIVQAELNLQRAKDEAAGGVSDEAVRSAQLSIDQIETKIADSSLYAPIDGVILEVYIAPGDAAQAYDTVIVIGLPEPKEVIASLAITDANRLSVGMTGVCQVMNFPDTAVGCIVRSIPLSSQDADQTTRVAASLENITDNQLIEVEMPLEVRENVLWLPPSVIRTFQNRTFVVLDTADGPRTVDVQLGLQTDERVEIVSGVNEDDVVIAP